MKRRRFFETEANKAALPEPTEQPFRDHMETEVQKFKKEHEVTERIEAKMVLIARSCPPSKHETVQCYLTRLYYLALP